MIYTGIGSRETPADILTLMMVIGKTLAENNWVLRSGGAPGADSAFERGAKGVGPMSIYLPWDGFNGRKASDPGYVVVTGGKSIEAMTLASKTHPAWDRCSQAARLLHTRNVYQILGENLDTPSDMVICWTKEGRRGGGTGQALRLAEARNIPIFDLAVTDSKEIISFIQSREK